MGLTAAFGASLVLYPCWRCCCRRDLETSAAGIEAGAAGTRSKFADALVPAKGRTFRRMPRKIWAPASSLLSPLSIVALSINTAPYRWNRAYRCLQHMEKMSGRRFRARRSSRATFTALEHFSHSLQSNLFLLTLILAPQGDGILQKCRMGTE